MKEAVKSKRLADNDTEVETKKMKSNGFESFKGAKFIEVLNENVEQKILFLLARLPSTANNEEFNNAVVILEKKKFPQGAGEQILDGKIKLDTIQFNDVFSTYSTLLPADYCHAKVTVICPATSKHIDKYRASKKLVVSETEQDYLCVTKPMLEENLEKKVFNLQWIYNILEGKSEKEKVLVKVDGEKTGFVVVMDYKWQGEDPETMHCLALPLRRDLRSLRDLRGEHVPMLEEMRRSALAAIQSKCQLKEGEVRAYLHYQPSFYHLHVHFTNVNCSNTGTDSLRAHPLETVIENLKMNDGYYEKMTLRFVLSERDPLFLEFKKAGKV